MARASLPPGMTPASLNRDQAALFVGVSANTFDAMVTKGVMPKPRGFAGRLFWLPAELSQAVYDLPILGDASGETPDGKSELDKMLGT